MAVQNPLLAPSFSALLAESDIETLRDFCNKEHPKVIAEALYSLDEKQAWEILKLIEISKRAWIFSHMDEDLQVKLVDSIQRIEVARILAEMPPDDRVDLIKRLPEAQRETLLPALAQAEREDIRRLISHKEGTAGAVMTSDYATLTPDLTAAQALERLREVAPDKETIYYAYVVDEHRRLLGLVSLKNLITARREASVEQIMNREVIYARVDEDQEAAARRIQKFDLIALPVIDAQDTLVGIVTHDDAIDIITQEHTEDMEKLMAIAGAHEAGVYLKTSAWRHFTNRAYWVVGLAALGLISGMIIHSFEATLMQLLILALYMPMVADAGGNTGSQSATVIVRAIALGEIAPTNIFRVLRKEFLISLQLALVLGLLAWAKVMYLSRASEVPAGFSLAKIAAAIAFALSLQVITSTLIGALLPLCAARIKLDPAVVASPALTTIVDITGLLIYFTMAKALLGI